MVSAPVPGVGMSTPVKPATTPSLYRASQRLRTAADFDRVFKKNVRSRDQYFVVLARPNHLTYARLGLAISRKAAGDAVPRNRLKRLVRESFRVHQEPLSCIDCVVMARPGAARHDGSTLLKSLNKHWTQVTKKCTT